MNDNSRDDDEYVGMKTPDKREVLQREDMVCPKCVTEGLEEHPGYSREYTGLTEVIRATRCPNKDCDNHHGVDRDDIKMQMPDNLLLEKVKRVSVNAELILVIALAVGFGLYSVGAFETESSEQLTQVSGTVENIGPGGEIVLESSVESRKADIPSSGSFTLPEVPPGVYETYVISNSSESSSSPIKSLSIENGILNIQNETERVSVRDNRLRFQLSDAVKREKQSTTRLSSYVINYDKRVNAQKGVEVSVLPVKSGDITERKTISNTEGVKQYNLPASPVKQQIRVDSVIREKWENSSYQYFGSPIEFDIGGTIKPKNTIIEIPSTGDEKARSFNVRGRTVKTIDVESGPTNRLKIKLKGGESKSSELISGTTSGKTLELDSRSTTHSISLSPVEQEDTAKKRGEVNNGKAIIDGIDQETIGELSFTSQSDTQDYEKETVEVGTKQSEETITKELGQVDREGTYRLTVDYEYLENKQNTDFYYVINGNENLITSQSDKLLDLSLGDSVSIKGVSTSGYTSLIGPEDSPYDGDDSPIVISNVKSRSEASIGESVDISVTAENPTDKVQSKPIHLYVDGENKIQNTISLEPDEKKNIDVASIRLSQSGAHTIRVSDSDMNVINVGEGSGSDIGKGIINATLTQVETTDIKVDTTGNGNYDCILDTTTATCSVNLSPNINEFNVSAPEDTQYELRYSTTEFPKNVTVEIDGKQEISVDQIINDFETKVDVPINKSFTIQSGNNIPVNYTIYTIQQNSIPNPTIRLDGEIVVFEDGRVRTPKTYITKELSQGRHIIKAGLSSDKSYRMTLNWTEAGEYPGAIIDGKQECAPEEFSGDGRCIVQGLDLGSHTISLSGQSEASLNILKRQKYVSDSVKVDVNNYSKNLKSTQSREWSKNLNASPLTFGRNKVNISSDLGKKSLVTGILNYTYEINAAKNPTIVVISSDGAKNTIEISDKYLTLDGRLKRPVKYTIEPNWFSKGENKVFVNTSNSGAVKLGVNAVTSEEGDIKKSFER